MIKTEFSASHDPSEIILIHWLLINAQLHNETEYENHITFYVSLTVPMKTNIYVDNLQAIQTNLLLLTYKNDVNSELTTV